MPTPPYRIVTTPNFSEIALRESLQLAENLLDRRIDEFPRPFLCESDPSLTDVYEIHFEVMDRSAQITQIERAGARHQAIWFHSGHWELDADHLVTLMERRLDCDPYCTMDFVFFTKTVLDDSLLNRIKQVLNNAVQSYLSRVLAHRDENMQRRIVIILQENSSVSEAWIEHMFDRADVFFYQEQKLSNLRNNWAEIGIKRPMVWISDPTCPEQLWNQLKAEVDPEAISFKSRELERRWSNEVLGYGEV
jgi:hypothetical protein